mgnify:CR=1 FL=1
MSPLFSVLLSVYKNDNPEHFRIALESITSDQTVRPSEVILVVDGPVPNGIDEVISDVQKDASKLYHIIRFDKNQGLGIALQKGMEVATNDIVIRMDSDDIAVPDRLDRQIRFMISHQDVAICGGQIEEFVDEENNIVGKRMVPCSNDDIRNYMKSRCPFNHMTVALRRSEVLRAGNYQPWFWNEDYYLWIRMMLAGCKFANLLETLVHVRVGKDMYARRGGMKYFKSEEGIQRFMLKNHLVSFPRYLFNVSARLAVQVLMPNWVRGFVFQKLFRKK